MLSISTFHGQGGNNDDIKKVGSACDKCCRSSRPNHACSVLNWLNPLLCERKKWSKLANELVEPMNDVVIVVNATINAEIVDSFVSRAKRILEDMMEEVVDATVEEDAETIDPDVVERKVLDSDIVDSDLVDALKKDLVRSLVV